ncbi:hypothetical protein, variant [Aphanomyces astaci]|uniref:Uncharacterized protein n=1 Tax=Aphanomyces astaci TaxID=112090 RepID=W4FTT7_APHAT|nr:hypothetical protein, variant [Aphanomyces astaci]ETV70239.1 hypothetical protein, variant [Aphanomyces astaci]|eukprot:XP_009840334.1 hypothetical protein, variant [Aphanomyces astaci]
MSTATPCVGPALSTSAAIHLRAYLARGHMHSSSSVSIPALFPRPGVHTTSSALPPPRTPLQQALMTWRHHKLATRVLTWVELQHVQDLVHESATLLPAEKVVANVVVMHLSQGTKDNLPPPHLDELDLIEVTLNQPLLSFDQFTALRPQLPPAAATYCTADVFMQLQPHDAHGRIYGLAWLAVVEQASAQVATYALLRNADICDRGYLIESDVTGMVTTWLDTVPWTQSIDPAFIEYYIRIAARLVWLPLVPYRTGKLSIDKAMKSTVVQSLIPLLCREYHNSPQYSRNPFATDNIQRFHRQYVQLDSNKNGMLSPYEVLQYGRKKAFVGIDQRPTHALTRRFVQRVFDELVTFDGEMDYNTFLDLNMYLRDTTSKHALQFFWRILDVHRCGTLNSDAIGYFLEDIAEAVFEATNEPLATADLRVRPSQASCCVD